MAASTETPVVFISYSWKPVANQKRVENIAKRLSSDGIHVMIDLWDLKVGHDKYHFMEKMVNDPKVNKVLLMCNKEYAEKANNREGGVGTESTIISPEIYGNVEQEKFIAVVMERDNTGKEYVPTFVSSRLYIDFSIREREEEEYQTLVKNLYGKPSNIRPVLGSAPAYVTTENAIFLPTTHRIEIIKEALELERKNAILLIKQFFEVFIEALLRFKIDDTTVDLDKPFEIDEIFLEKVAELIPLRDDFNNFIKMYHSSSLMLDADALHEFFENLINISMNGSTGIFNNSNLNAYANELMKFFVYELFINFTAIMIRYGRFAELGYILNTPFLVNSERHNTITSFSFERFRSHISVLEEYRKKKLNANRVSMTADLLKQRESKMVKWEEIMQADAILYYVSIMGETNGYGYFWYPVTSAYTIYNLPVLDKARSKRFFEKLMPLFSVRSKDELIQKVNSMNETRLDFYYRVPQLRGSSMLSDLATI
jgi:hypothetical protein